MSPEEARGLFPATGEGVYLDTANFGLLASTVAEKIAGMLRSLTAIPRGGGSARYLELESAGEPARQEIARLVGASPEEIALVESTSHGLQIAARAIPLSPGDEVVVAGWDFLGIPLAWRPAVERGEVRLRQVDLRSDSDPTRALIEALQPRTRALSTNSVTEAHGIRLRLPELAQACREKGVWLVVDVMQEAGVRALHLDRSGVDFAAAGGHKWLGCPFGTGFLYVRKERLLELKLPSLGYLGLEEPAGGWEGYLGSPTAASVLGLAPHRKAQRLEIGGTPNFPGRLALAESCALLNRVGIEAIENHVLHLTAFLWQQLSDAGFQLITPRAEDSRAGIVTFSLGDAHRERARVEELAKRGVHVSLRYNQGRGGVRVSVHLYNNRQDVEHFIEALSESLAGDSLGR